MSVVTCPFCEEPVLETDDARAINGIERGAHRECLLRTVMGSIEHLTMGPHTIGACNENDRGLTYRENARLVDQWVTEHGVEDETLGAE